MGKQSHQVEPLFGCPPPATLWLGAKWDNPYNFTQPAPDLHNQTPMNSGQSNEVTRHMKPSHVYMFHPNNSCFTIYLYCKRESWFHQARRESLPASSWSKCTSILHVWGVDSTKLGDNPHLSQLMCMDTSVLPPANLVVPLTLPDKGCILVPFHCSWASETLQKAR